MIDRAHLSSSSPTSGRNDAIECRRSFAHENEVGETEQGEYLHLVFRQAAVAGLAMAEQVLDHMQRMLDLTP